MIRFFSHIIFPIIINYYLSCWNFRLCDTTFLIWNVFYDPRSLPPKRNYTASLLRVRCNELRINFKRRKNGEVQFARRTKKKSEKNDFFINERKYLIILKVFLLMFNFLFKSQTKKNYSSELNSIGMRRCIESIILINILIVARVG